MPAAGAEIALINASELVCANVVIVSVIPSSRKWATRVLSAAAAPPSAVAAAVASWNMVSYSWAGGGLAGQTDVVGSVTLAVSAEHLLLGLDFPDLVVVLLHVLQRLHLDHLVRDVGRFQVDARVEIHGVFQGRRRGYLQAKLFQLRRVQLRVGVDILVRGHRAGGATQIVAHVRFRERVDLAHAR